MIAIIAQDTVRTGLVCKVPGRHNSIWFVPRQEDVFTCPICRVSAHRRWTRTEGAELVQEGT